MLIRVGYDSVAFSGADCDGADAVPSAFAGIEERQPERVEVNHTLRLQSSSMLSGIAAVVMTSGQRHIWLKEESYVGWTATRIAAHTTSFSAIPGSSWCRTVSPIAIAGTARSSPTECRHTVGDRHNHWDGGCAPFIRPYFPRAPGDHTLRWSQPAGGLTSASIPSCKPAMAPGRPGGAAALIDRPSMPRIMCRCRRTTLKTHRARMV